MRNLRSRFSFSLVPFCSGVVALLAVSYIGLIAVVMSYAALTVGFSQSVKASQASVAQLESHYLAALGDIEHTDYRAEGYASPQKKIFVPSASMTALR